MLEKLNILIDSNSFTYHFVKIGLYAFVGIILFEIGKFVGHILKYIFL